jgi:hypothetical protein
MIGSHKHLFFSAFSVFVCFAFILLFRRFHPFLLCVVLNKFDFIHSLFCFFPFRLHL